VLKCQRSWSVVFDTFVSACSFKSFLFDCVTKLLCDVQVALSVLLDCQ